jgi:hypothetical protein
LIINLTDKASEKFLSLKIKYVLRNKLRNSLVENIAVIVLEKHGILKASEKSKKTIYKNFTNS